MHQENMTLARTMIAWQIDKLCLCLALMLGLPFLIHLLPYPAGQAGGAVWLPIFYAPLFAVLFFRPHVAFIAAGVAPTLNRLLTGLPEPAMACVLTVELMVFVFILEIWHQRIRDSWAMGVVAYTAAKIFSVLLFRWGLGSTGFPTALIYLYETWLNALPGLCVVTMLNLLALRLMTRTIHDQIEF